jgi:hypothetical protein
MPGLRGLDPRKKPRALFRVFLSGPEWVLAAQWGRIRPDWGSHPRVLALLTSAIEQWTDI